MNVALSALVVFLVLLPGFLVRSRFKLAERTSLDYSPFGQVVAEAVLWAAVLHGLWLAGAHLLLGRVLRVEVLLRLLSSDAPSQARAIDALATQAAWVGQYFATLLAFAFIAPTLMRLAVVRWKLDRAGTPLAWLLRFHAAPWYYLLTGADFARGDEPDFIAVSAIVEVAGEPVLYTGIVDDFFLDEAGQLDRLVLQQVMRRPMSADKRPGQEATSRFYPIDGDYFVLRYSEAVTLNIQYVRLAPQGE